jgi:hypothetical protein
MAGSVFPMKGSGPHYIHTTSHSEATDVSRHFSRYTRRINFREGWSGHLWQGRFASFVTRKITRALA